MLINIKKIKTHKWQVNAERQSEKSKNMQNKRL